MTVLYAQQGHVVTLTINRPDAMNAIDPETHQALIEAWTRFRDDDSAWVAIFTGAGEKSFSAGADLKKMIPAAFGEGRRRSHHDPGLGGITRGLEIWKPMIAAVNGFCLAGGLEQALACDLRVAAPHDRGDHRHLRALLELVDLVVQRVGGSHRAAGAVDAKDQALDVLVLLRLAKLLLHARENRNARRRRRERQAQGLVGQQAREIHQENLRRPLAFDGFFVEGTDARLKIDREDGTAGEQERRRAHVDKPSRSHGRSIRVRIEAHKRSCSMLDTVNDAAAL